MVVINQPYKKTNLSLDIVLLSMIFQSVIIKDWLAFKKTFLNDRNHFFGTLIGLIIFVFLLFFCDGKQRSKATLELKKSFPHVDWTTPTFADVIRFFIQTLWLVTIQTKTACDSFLFNLKLFYQLLNIIRSSIFLPFTWITKSIGAMLNKMERSGENYHDKFEPSIYLLFIFLLGIICLTVPFNISSQIIFIFMLWLTAMIARSIVGHLPKLILITLSLIISTRYLWWRYTSTLNIDSSVDIFFGVILICAETYTWLILLLGYFQIAWPLQRKPVALPADTDIWPSVDIFIPTYNEELDIVKTTTLAALAIDWPEDKLNIFILDDGERVSFQEFAAQVGVGYITRNNNLHAKAGNINQALTVTKGDYVTIFDCDHIPVRSFLQLTMGWFLIDKKLALIQTPHHFYSPDPFERNIGNFKKTPNENSLFYGVVQDGNDLWNASFFCGSCAILKREPLLEVGGIAVETVTEDAHTALRLHRKGYTSAYINVIQAAGLATETLSAHVGQRIRWARGMAQIFRIDNPLLGKGLNIGQRLCYANAMIHFLGGIPRLIFLLAPLGYLFFHSYLIYAPTAEVLLYAIPAIVHSSIANSYMQGNHRYSFWAEIYETVLAWYIARPTTIALINPKIGKFNVTTKGGLIKDDFFDLSISKPYLFLITLNLLGVAAAIYRYSFGPVDEQSTVMINFVWTAYNLMVLGGAISVAQETKQVRMQHRIEVNTEVVIKKESGHLIRAMMEDYSGSGLGLRINSKAATIEKNEKIYVLISRGEREFVLPARVTNVNKGFLGIEFENLTHKQQFDYIQSTYSRSDAWVSWNQYFSQDKPLSSIIAIISVGFHGYIILARKLPKFIAKPFLLLGTSMVFVKTLLPKNIKDNPIQHEHA